MNTSVQTRPQAVQLAAGRPRVLQVATSGLTFKALLLPLVDRLESEGFSVSICCSDGPHTRELVAQGYRVLPVQIDRRISLASNLRSLWQLYRLMRRERFDIVHVHTPVAAVLGRLAARLAGVPLIIYTAHGFYFHEHMRPAVRRAVVWVEKLLGSFTDMLLAQSQEDAATAVEERICPPCRVRWIGNGVDVARFGAVAGTGRRASFPGLGPQARVVGFVGRLVGEKGILELVQAMEEVAREVPQARLLLVGDTLEDDRDRGFKEVLRGEIARRGLASRIVATGFVEEVEQALAAMDVFVLPSYREGMPRTILEAMASGKPVVATNIRGCREEVVHGVTGLLVPVKDSRALAQAIVQVLSDPEAARRMGEAGQRRAVRLFDERMVVHRQLEIYRELVKARLGVVHAG